MTWGWEGRSLSPSICVLTYRNSRDPFPASFSAISEGPITRGGVYNGIEKIWQDCTQAMLLPSGVCVVGGSGVGGGAGSKTQ